MRRSLIVLLMVVSACSRNRWQGSQTLSRTVETRPDSVMAAATRALRAHGYEPILVDSILLVTAPHALPAYTRNVSTAQDSTARWVLQVQVSPAFEATETRVTIAAFVLPPEQANTGSTATTSRGVLVTSKDPQLFAEVQRVGDWILDEAEHRASVGVRTF